MAGDGRWKDWQTRNVGRAGRVGGGKNGLRVDLFDVDETQSSVVAYGMKLTIGW